MHSSVQASTEREIVIQLYIPADEFVEHYRGVDRVVARSVDGRRVQFPASALRRFVTHEGVRGCFSFRITPQGRLVSVQRLS